MVITENENGTVQYSIDGGITYQASNIFNNLLPGDYTITVLNAEDCTAEASTTVDFVSGINPIDHPYTISVAPNPTNGFFRMTVEGIDVGSTFLNLTVFDANGKIVYVRYLTKYDGIYTGMLSLYSYPAGVYYVRFDDEEVQEMVKMVKVD